MTDTRLLDDVRVVDLTDDYGAYASRLLAELGADVVRIEPAGGGRGRLRTPLAADGTSLHHLHRNLGKLCLQDISPPVIDGLLAGADVAFCQDDADALVARHPHLIAVAVSPFGWRGSVADWMSTELVSQAIAGVVHRAGVPDLAPVAAPGSFCEDVGAVMAAVAALAALWQQRHGGSGQSIDVSTVLSLAQCTDTAIPIWSLLHADQTRSGAGMYPLFECTDGLARIVLPMSPPEWRHLIAWLGSPAAWTGPNWETPMLGLEERSLVLARLPERFAAGTRAEIAADGDRAGVRITPVLSPAEVLTNEHVEARGTFISTAIGSGSVRVPTSVFGVGGARSEPRPLRTVTDPPAWSARTSRSRSAAAPSLPLAGVRVLEIGTGVAGPEAGRVLGEWGADVIRVESRRRPDFYRKVMGGDMNPPFASANRNKRTLAADLGTEDGRALIRRLIPHVDVVIENNATGVLDRLGLGYDTVSPINDRIIVVSSQLYGDRGPWANKKGYGPSARAIGGLTWLWAHGPDSPRGVQTIHPDHLAGRLIALGALAALVARDRTGTGCHVDVAQFEAVIALLGDLLAAEDLAPGAAQPQGNTSTTDAPWGLFRAEDDDRGAQRWIAICVSSDDEWSALTSVAPVDLDRHTWRTRSGRLAEATLIHDAVAGWVRSTDAAILEQRLHAVGVAAGQALFPRTQADHPLFVEHGFLQHVDQPGSGALLLEGPAFTASGFGPPRCDPAPLPGQHTREILGELLGTDDDEIARLIEVGAIDSP